jgi:hypothetical protein
VTIASAIITFGFLVHLVKEKGFIYIFYTRMKDTTDPNRELFEYLKTCISYYEPNKVNKKKIKELFSCLPYFVSGEDQDILYPLLLRHPIDCYYDSEKGLRDYVYLLYRLYHREKNKPYLDHDTFYRTDKQRRERNHHIYFGLVVCLLIYYLYCLQ